jgi:mannose-6-phosphate isomerase-like protein (cupin superfamily)
MIQPPRRATRVVPDEQPVRPSPSGLLTRYLAWRETGSKDLFVAQQWLGQGQQVYLHTHAVEELLIYVSGTGTAVMENEEVTVGPGITLVVPPGVVHGFRNERPEPLHVLVVFPGDTFAPTDFVEPTPDQTDRQPGTVPEWP